MDPFYEAVDETIELLEGSGPAAEGVEHTAIKHLKRLKSAAKIAPRVGCLIPLVSDLRQFWITTVPWCSSLSKALEKVLIIHDELAQGQGCDRTAVVAVSGGAPKRVQR